MNKQKSTTIGYIILLASIVLTGCIWRLNTPTPQLANTPELTRFLLVRATPDHSGMLTFPVDRLTLDNGVLGEQQPLASQQWNARFVRAYHDQGLLLLGTMIKFGQFEIKYIWLNNPDEVITVPLDMCDDCGYINAFLLKKANELIFMLVDSGKTGSDTQGYNLQTGEHLALTSADLEFAVTLGIPGGNIRSQDVFGAIFAVQGQATFGRLGASPLGWYFPDDDSPSADQISTQLVNNEFIHAYSGNRFRYFKDNKPYINIKVLNKSNSQWSSITINGQLPNIRVFGQWLATEELIKHQKQIPPKDFLHDDRYLTAAAKEYVTGFKQTGLMTLINPITQQRISLQSDNTDIEILLVANEQVFYRIGDSLFQADMVENQLANTKLIVQDPKILDVHWMMAL